MRQLAGKYDKHTSVKYQGLCLWRLNPIFVVKNIDSPLDRISAIQYKVTNPDILVDFHNLITDIQVPVRVWKEAPGQ